jgi:hypothetical protein
LSRVKIRGPYYGITDKAGPSPRSFSNFEEFASEVKWK